jgi:hypothetical protein
MEVIRMARNNPYSDEPINAQPTEVMPDLPLKQVPQTPPLSESAGRGYGETEEKADVVQEDESGQTLKFVIGKFGDFLHWFLIVLEVTLGIRFLFRLIGADPSNIFANFLYALTGVVLFPFSGIVHDPSFHANQAFELTTLIGMGIYWLVFWLLRSFIRILVSEPQEPVE